MFNHGCGILEDISAGCDVRTGKYPLSCLYTVKPYTVKPYILAAI